MLLGVPALSWYSCLAAAQRRTLLKYRLVLEGQLFFGYEDDSTPTFLAVMEEIDKAFPAPFQCPTESDMACPAQKGQSWTRQSTPPLLGRLAFSPMPCAGQRPHTSWPRT